MTKYFNAFNIFECGRKFLDRLYVSYERACMEIQSTISDSTYFNSEEQVDAVSEAKVYRNYIFKNEYETINVFERENNLV